jgi:hypothetical protein
VDVRKVRILLRKNHKTRCFELVVKEDLKDFAISINLVSLCGGETWTNGRFVVDFYSNKVTNLVIFQIKFVADLPWGEITLKCNTFKHMWKSIII